MTQIENLRATLEQANGLFARARGPKGFGAYLRERKSLVAAACALLAPLPLACAAGVIGFLGQFHALFMLLGMILAPLVLVGSALVIAYLLFSWLETLALARALGHRVKHPLSAVPWLPVGVLVFLPLAMLATVAPLAALAALVPAAAAPFAYRHAERAGGLGRAAWYFYQYLGRLTNRGRAKPHPGRGAPPARRERGA